MSDVVWQSGKAYREIRYETCDGIAKITINRPERRNAFTPLTVNEMYDAFTVARDDACAFGKWLASAEVTGPDVAHRDECAGLHRIFHGQAAAVVTTQTPLSFRRLTA